MSDGGYDHRAIEAKWQKYWADHKTFKSEIDASKPKYYILDMFPYPSGDGLHVGHPLGYVATDIIARIKRMKGFNVLHPMGWDAFGLPAERHAVRTGEHPAIITRRNCDNFRRQLQALGLSYDWDRELDTTDPGYYKWTQWIFEVLFERGLAYQMEAPVNWCPAVGTVLANEEVKDGKYVETGDPVEKRMMRQWMLKITEYADRLLDDLDELEWPENVKSMQREWIGRSEGADVTFRVADRESSFMIFTTRPDTLFGATYCVLAPEHPLTLEITTPDRAERVRLYIEAASRRSAQDRMQAEREKTGEFTGAYAINPVNDQRIPIWTADYVLAEYGYGAIMAVPAHDERDYEFARKFNLSIVEVVSGGNIAEQAYTGDGTLVNSGLITGLSVPEAKRKISAWLEDQDVGKATINYRLRDWLFSRQRYWGEPIPILRLEDGTLRAVPMKDLPVVLPELDEYKPTSDGQPPLARATEWLNAIDPQTGTPATRETNTMPQWAGSCWYYLRFVDARNDAAAWSKDSEQYWMPVDLYVGGTEHAVLHLLYSRFWHKVLYDAGHVSTKEPFMRLFNPGKIQAYSYRDAQGKYYYPEQVEKRGDKVFVRDTDIELESQVEKMSKSRYNVVNPDKVVEEHGADSMRLYQMFMGPLDRDKPWTEEGLNGIHRFLRRVWSLVVADDGALGLRIVESGGDADMLKILHKTIKAVSADVDAMQFNTAISRMMEYLNAAYKAKAINQPEIEQFLLLLAPFAPHLCEELWSRLGHAGSVAYHDWPAYDETLLVENVIEIPIQVNGKLRSVVTVSVEANKEQIMETAKADAKVENAIAGKTLVKEVYIPGKLVNIVVK